MAELKQAAKKIKKAGQAEAPSDSILAHITPEEAMMLKAMGGSGRVDPKTGLPHFEENDENEGYNDDGSWDGGGGDTEGDGADDDKSWNEFKEMAEKPVSEINKLMDKGLGSGNRDRFGNVRGGGGGSDVTPSQAKFGLYDENGVRRSVNNPDLNLDQEILDNSHIETEYKLTNPLGLIKPGLGLVGSLATGNLPGIVGSAYSGSKAFTKRDIKTANNPEGASDFTKGGGPSLGDAEKKGNDNESPMEAQFRKTATPSAPATPPPSEQAAADDFDSFTQGARKKKGLQSTIVSGGAGGSGIAMNKTLLGA